MICDSCGGRAEGTVYWRGERYESCTRCACDNGVAITYGQQVNPLNSIAPQAWR
jgi:hypothetical protein